MPKNKGPGGIRQGQLLELTSLTAVQRLPYAVHQPLHMMRYPLFFNGTQLSRIIRINNMLRSLQAQNHAAKSNGFDFRTASSPV